MADTWDLGFRDVDYMDILPYQEGTPLTPIHEEDVVPQKS